MVDTLAYRVRKVDVQTLYYPLVKVDAKTLIYALTDRLPVVKKNKVDNLPVQGKVQSGA